MKKLQLPEKYSAVVLNSFSGAEDLRMEERSIPELNKNEVLVKVAATPINPSDLAFLEGHYDSKKRPPVVPGFEGSGTVVATGGSMMARNLLGKRVACLSPDTADGVWAEYMVTTAKLALPLHRSVNLEQGAMSVVNPLTAMSFCEIAKKDKHKTVVQTAAAGTLGQMINRLLQSEGIRVINIVRKESQMDLLRKQGAETVLNSSENEFPQKLRDICHQHNARLAFDAVAGPLSLQLLEAMPTLGKVTVYGALSQELVMANPGQFIFQRKAIDGFWLTDSLVGMNLLQFLKIWRRTQKLITKELKSEIRIKYPLKEAKSAILDYQKQMTGGKVLIIPNK
jgi:NADPH:quinone reductase-like Zn-dependent oxidoreductase